ncbi:MAG TPA: hypothetical protein GYA03_06850 [Tissierellia bacterium]|nr:hypothetical protein [Tissierellia bacterium]
MARYNRGSNFIKGYILKSIIDIELDCGITLSAFPGSLSPNDILLKYKEHRGTDRYRTPKHIHWVIDLMIKREHNKALTNELLEKHLGHTALDGIIVMRLERSFLGGNGGFAISIIPEAFQVSFLLLS